MLHSGMFCTHSKSLRQFKEATCHSSFNCQAHAQACQKTCSRQALGTIDCKARSWKFVASDWCLLTSQKMDKQTEQTNPMSMALCMSHCTSAHCGQSYLYCTF